MGQGRHSLPVTKVFLVSMNSFVDFADRRESAPFSRRRLLGAGLGLAAGAALFTPVAAGARQSVGSDGDYALPAGKRYLVKPLANRTYWVTDGAYSTMFIVTDEGVVACDAPPTLGANYLAAIREVTDKPVTHLIYSHEHVDHIGGSTVFPSGIEIIAGEETARLLRSRKDPLRRLPTKTFDKALVLNLGGQRLELSHRGANHSLDNIFIYAPAQKVLMFIDVVYPGWVPYKNLGVAVDIPGFVEAHKQILGYDFDTLVAGHVSRPGIRADVLTQIELLRDLAQAAEDAYQSLSFPAYLAKAPADPQKTSWDRHNDYESSLVSDMHRRLLPKWRTRLKGADTYLRDNCWAMLETYVVQGRPDI
jgi:glyoxylase-like metal-dependent hydrolase (beta-lactamase superfamily II)